MRSILFILPFVSLLTIGVNAQNSSKSFYSFQVETIIGDTFDFSALKGKKVMIVNTASKCGFTPQFEDLEKLYNKYKEQNFVVIGFPSNDFFNQDPKDNEEIHSFCKKNYGVSFPMMAKIKVKGKDKHDLYEYLTSKELNGVEDSKVKWNFQKYLINENGVIEKIITPSQSPMSEDVINWLEEK